jgi:hypothetical protein
LSESCQKVGWRAINVAGRRCHGHSEINTFVLESPGYLAWPKRKWFGASVEGFQC